MSGTRGTDDSDRTRSATLSRHWKMAVLAAAGFATIVGTTTLVAVTDDGKAKSPAAVADKGKGKTGPTPAKTTTTRGGSAETDEDGDYWAERAGNPDANGSGSSGSQSGDSSERGRSGDHAGNTGSGATGSGSHEKKGPDAADTQKRSARPSSSAGQNGPEGHGSGDGQGGHREGSGREGEDWEGWGGHDDSGDGHGKARLVDCDPNDLIWAIIQANSDGGGTLTLAEKCTYTLTANQDGNGLPEIIQPITIDGNGATIARAANADQFRFFEVGVGGDLKLRHLTLTRGKAAVNDDGGAIHVTPAGRLDLDCVTLHNNTVDDTNGYEGGAIYNEGITTIRNSTLSSNSASRGSGVSNNGGKLEITTSKLTGNTANSDGAVRNANGTTTISKSLLSHNYGSAVDQDDDAGLIEIDKSAILYNHDDSGGGGIDFTPTGSGGLHVRKSTIAYNTAADDDGGGLRITGSAVIEDSKIYGNTIVDGNGGGVIIGQTDGEIVAPGEAAIRRTVISGNQAPGDGNTGGGIYITEQSTLNLTNGKITDNTSDEEPGGIDNNGTVTTHGRVKIIDNVPTNCQGSSNSVPNCFG
ncbi:hypothetical protein ACFXOM_25410 [Streptomyces sp. NPDC059169]|uniref:hypothetical protein n=1 Tax=Streptomyces sp. NPDC059169 TaxID=3346754 RepID=UPI003699B295